MGAASAFDDITLGWRGQEYRIPATRVLECIARVEEVITLHDVMEMGQTGRIRLAPISRGYAVILRYAGCKVTDDEAYAGIFKQGARQEDALQLIGALLTMMLPRDVKAEASVIAEAAVATKGKVRSRRSAAGGSPKSAGKRQSSRLRA